MKGVVSSRWVSGVLTAGLLLGVASSASAFALLGPFASWMAPNWGYRKSADKNYPRSGDIGGPMNLGEEYRWTVPVVTYGFDRTFLDYFGQPGVDAVEQAIQTLNDLPPASEMSPTNYPLWTLAMSYYAYFRNLCDLKSTTLSLLLEQMGLAEATRYVWTIREWDPALFCPSFPIFDELALEAIAGPLWTNYVQKRSVDPLVQQPMRYVNGVAYTFSVYVWDMACTEVEAVEIPVNPLYGDYLTAVADGDLPFGGFYTGLTYDDAGGLLYLLSRTNVNVETLDDTIVTADGSTNALVRTAPRPGVEKITFLRHATNAGGDFAVMTNRFDDLYFTNGVLATQQVCRIVAQPDILFRATDFGCRVSTGSLGQPWVDFPTAWERTGLARWTNNADLNANWGGDGPGVIRPPVQLTFHTPGRYLAATGGSVGGTNYWLWNWARFTNGLLTDITFLPGNQTNLTSLTLATRTFETNTAAMFEWTVLGRDGGHYRIDAATNLTDWLPLTVVTNLGGIFRFAHPAAEPEQFFRAVLEE